MVQNRLEVFLLGCSMLVLFLGVVYAFVVEKDVAVEAALITVLFGSMGGAALFIVVKHGREQPGVDLATRPAAPAALNLPAEDATTPPQTGRPQAAPKKKLSTVGERLTPPFTGKSASHRNMQETVEDPLTGSRGPRI